MRALITGGGGFLGGALARKLKERGDSVRVFGRGSYPELEARGIETFRADLNDSSAVTAACDDRDIVFHVAAKVGLWGSYEDYFAANVTGTHNVLGACLKTGVRKLVFTGSPSVVFDGRDVEGWSEEAPYSAHFDSYYSRTKAQSEQMVLAANHDRLATVSLRPHLVWGPGDRHLLPRLIARGRAGRLFRIGDHNKKVDATYVDDAVSAHVLAAVQLSPISDIAGKAYFLSGGDPRPVWDIIEALLSTAGLGGVHRTVPTALAAAAARACEASWRAFGVASDPPLTRFLVNQLTTAHWFDIRAAKRDLGWHPTVSLEEGVRRTAQWLKVTKAYA